MDMPIFNPFPASLNNEFVKKTLTFSSHRAVARSLNVTVCEGDESGWTQLHNVWKTGDFLREIQLSKLNLQGLKHDKAGYINSRLESSRRDHRKQPRSQK